MIRAVLAALVACAGCTYDFDTYLPVPGAVDAAADVEPTCTPDGGDACYATARACSATCASQRSTCEAACSNPGCRKTCREAEVGCKATCRNNCTACTTSGGCATASRCATEVG